MTIQHKALGAWLVDQERTSRWHGELANAAKRDPRFPKNGGPYDVLQLQKQGAEGDWSEMLADAERDWSAGE